MTNTPKICPEYKSACIRHYGKVWDRKPYHHPGDYKCDRESCQKWHICKEPLTREEAEKLLLAIIKNGGHTDEFKVELIIDNMRKLHIASENNIKILKDALPKRGNKEEGNEK